MMKKDYLMLYRNYLFALEERKNYGEKYGDTIELMEYYEKELKKVGFQRKDKETRGI